MILFCGDPHGQFEHIVHAVQEHQPAAIILLGDLQCPLPLHQVLAPIQHLTDIWFIHGNHDTDSDTEFDHLWHSTLAARNLHGRVEIIGGLRIAGLGGIFRDAIWMPPTLPRLQDAEAAAQRYPEASRWRSGIPREHYSSIFPADHAHLATHQADILVSHEAPSCHPEGFAAVDDLAHRLGVRRSFHGHQHDSRNYRAHDRRLGFQAWGVGLRGILDEYGQTVRAVEVAI